MHGNDTHIHFICKQGILTGILQNPKRMNILDGKHTGTAENKQSEQPLRQQLPHLHAACDSCRLVCARLLSPHFRRGHRLSLSRMTTLLLPASVSAAASAPSAPAHPRPRPHRPLPPTSHSMRVWWVVWMMMMMSALATRCACRRIPSRRHRRAAVLAPLQCRAR